MRTINYRLVSNWAWGLLALATFSVGQLSGSLSVAGRLTHVYEGKGKNYVGVITIRNVKDKPQVVKVYQTDYFTSADGNVSFEAPGSRPRSNAPWISLSRERFEMPADEKVDVNYSIQVPDDPSLKGTYWSTICVEPEVELKKAQKGLALIPIFRYVIQVINRVGEDPKASLKADNNQYVINEELQKKFFQIDLFNNGDLDLRPETTLELLDQNGNLVTQAKGNMMRLYPGCSGRFNFDLTGVPKGDYLAVIIMDAGGENLFGAQYELTVD